VSARGRLNEPSGPCARRILSNVRNVTNDMLRTADVYGHAFIRARPGKLNVSWDRVDDQSQIDHSWPCLRRSPTRRGHARGHASNSSSHSARATATRAFRIPFRTASRRAHRPNRLGAAAGESPLRSRPTANQGDPALVMRPLHCRPPLRSTRGTSPAYSPSAAHLESA